MKLILFCFVSSFLLLMQSSNLMAGDIETSGLTAPTETERVAAYRDLSQKNIKLAEALIDIVRSDKSTSYYGGKSLAIQLLGELRSERATGVLLQNLTFCPLDRPVEESIPTQAYYVAAAALVKIGTPATQDVVARMANTSSELEAKLCAWILKESLGQHEALRRCINLETLPDKAISARGAAMKEYITNFKPTSGPPGRED